MAHRYIIYAQCLNLQNISIRITPYTPIFNTTDARITLPNDGASTWALGSHKCNRYKGLLTSIGIDSISTDRVLDIQMLVTYLRLVP